MVQKLTRHVRLLLLATLLLAPAAWALAPVGKFNVGGATVVDVQTGLEWQKDVSATKMTWAVASATCADLSLGGKDDWRLPEVQELLSLVDFTVTGLNPYIDATAFGGTPWGMYWTATPPPVFQGGTQRFFVSFGSNSGPAWGPTPPDGTLYVRCVR